MPGYVKVDGVQHPVAAPYVKVNGTWSPVVLAYTKVAGEWKIWHASKIEDNFNRADGEIGTASNGFSQWDVLKGAWAISGNKAVSPTASGYAIAVAQLYKVNTNVVATVDIPSNSGLGICFWVEDADNWWSAHSWRETVNNPGYYSCPSGYSLNGTTCSKSTYLGEGTWVPPQSYSYEYCPNGGSISNGYCTSTRPTNYVSSCYDSCNVCAA